MASAQRLGRLEATAQEQRAAEIAAVLTATEGTDPAAGLALARDTLRWLASDRQRYPHDHYPNGCFAVDAVLARLAAVDGFELSWAYQTLDAVADAQAAYYAGEGGDGPT